MRWFWKHFVLQEGQEQYYQEGQQYQGEYQQEYQQ